MGYFPPCPVNQYVACCLMYCSGGLCNKVVQDVPRVTNREYERTGHKLTV